MRPLYWFLLIIGAFGFGIIIFNFVIMPWIVGRGKEVIVPNLIGKPLIEAQKLIIAQNFILGDIQEMYDTVFPQGYIIQQKPLPGSIVKQGRRINFYISKGTKKVKVPFLVQMSLERAMVILSNLGLNPTSIESIRSTNIPVGKIVGIEPESGSEIALGSPLKIVISGGTRGTFKMPNLTGILINEAMDSIVNNGLVIGAIQETPSDHAIGTVLIQYPEDGMKVKTGDTVKLIIAQRKR